MKQIDNKAIKHLNLSLKIDSAYIPSLFLLAKIHIENEQYGLAKADLDKIEQIDCENAELFFLNSKLAFKKKSTKKLKSLSTPVLPKNILPKRRLNWH